ncbi:MAG: prephenate dehydratase domain-containing protein [Bacillota bacterium]|nr:prephenate dehydratase domain-containing protein [Bacillota bacterium]
MISDSNMKEDNSRGGEDATREAGLAPLREQIDAVDARLLEAYRERRQIVAAIATAKGEANRPVRDRAREVEKLHAHPEEAPLLRTLMRLSRAQQYHQRYESGARFPIGEEIATAAEALPPIHAVTTQGDLNSYGAAAARELFPEAQIMPLRTFVSACRQVVDDNVKVAVLPLENSSSGIVHEVYDLLTRHRLYIVGQVAMEIQHRLLGLPGTRLGDIRRVISHPQALAQCSTIIQGMGWQIEESQNTAFAARSVAERGDNQLAALASADAGRSHGLVVLSDEVANVADNQTLFVAVARRPVIVPEASRVSLLLSLPHQAGSLAELLATFADLNLNLSRIQSLPVPKRPWQYSFYIDIDVPARDEAMLEALYQLSLELPSLRFLGWYPVRTVLDWQQRD